MREERAELEKMAAEGDAEAAAILAEDPVLGSAQGEGLKARIPFGPFLILACLEYLLVGERLVRSYLAWYFSVLG